MRQLLRHAIVTVAAVAFAGCATMSVSSHVRSGLDVSQYRTFGWGPADALPTGDPRLDKDPFFQDRVQGAVEKQLAAKGFEYAAEGTPDLLIHYHANVTDRIDVNTADRAYGYCSGDECIGAIDEYEAGTLVLDIVDARTKTLIWRGWAQDSVEGVIGNEDRLARKIDEAVTRMLARFPGRL